MAEAERPACSGSRGAERDAAADAQAPAGALVPRQDSASCGVASLPRLPPELLSHILAFLAPASLANDPLTHRTLAALACTSRLMRHWALRVRYAALVLPRHVRDFRRWYGRIRAAEPPFVCAGYTRALFSGLDDVSRLTAASSGWETEFLRLLHYLGRHITHLSLWHAESRCLLRDHSQVHRPRPRQANGKRSAIPRLQPSWAWGEGLHFSDDDTSDSSSSFSSEGEEQGEERSAQGQGTELAAAAAPDEALRARQAAAAARERARAVPPKWLLDELASDAQAAHRHRAHLPAEPLEDLKVPHQRAKATRESWGCAPQSISLCVGGPHVEDRNWPRLKFWRRCRELDLFVPVTTYVPRVLTLLSTLHRLPLVRLRISSPHATLLLALPPFSRRTRGGAPASPFDDDAPGDAADTAAAADDDDAAPLAPPNLAHSLTHLSSCAGLKSAVLAEFAGTHLDDISILEGLVTSLVLLGADAPHLWRALPAGACCPLHCAEPASPPRLRASTGEERIRVRIHQRGQSTWGRLATRRSDFVERAYAGGMGAWKTLGAWDD